MRSSVASSSSESGRRLGAKSVPARGRFTRRPPPTTPASRRSIGRAEVDQSRIRATEAARVQVEGRKVLLEVDVEPLASGRLCMMRSPTHDFSPDTTALPAPARWVSSKNVWSPPSQATLTNPTRTLAWSRAARHPAETVRADAVHHPAAGRPPWDSTSSTISSSVTEPRQEYPTSSHMTPSLAPAHSLAVCLSAGSVALICADHSARSRSASRQIWRGETFLPASFPIRLAGRRTPTRGAREIEHLPRQRPRRVIDPAIEDARRRDPPDACIGRSGPGARCRRGVAVAAPERATCATSRAACSRDFGPSGIGSACRAAEPAQTRVTVGRAGPRSGVGRTSRDSCGSIANVSCPRLRRAARRGHHHEARPPHPLHESSSQIQRSDGGPGSGARQRARCWSGIVASSGPG